MAITTHLYEGDIPKDLVLGNSLSIDCEMTGLNFYRDRLCVLQLFCPESQSVHIVQFKKDNYSASNLKNLLNNPNTEFLGHMIRLDMQFIYKYLGVVLVNVFCTRTASRIARTNGASHNLDSMLNDLLAITIKKEQTHSDWTNELTKAQIEYAKEDVVYLHQLKSILNDALLHEGREEYMALAMEMLPRRVVLDVAGWSNEDILSFPF